MNCFFSFGLFVLRFNRHFYLVQLTWVTENKPDGYSFKRYSFKLATIEISIAIIFFLHDSLVCWQKTNKLLCNDNLKHLLAISIILRSFILIGRIQKSGYGIDYTEFSFLKIRVKVYLDNKIVRC